MRTITYYAFFTPDAELKDSLNISFPGLPGCLSCAFNEDQGIEYAQEALSLYLHGISIDNLPPIISLSDLPDHGHDTTVHAITITMIVKDGRLIDPDVVDY